MPSAAENTVKPAQRVPAWKRLGLKLKSASETPAPAEETQTPKRKQSPIENGTVSKRIKIGLQVSPSTVTSPNTPTLTRKKSVSFTPETKIEDGDSIKQLFNGWVAEQKEEDPAFELKNTTSNSALRTIEPPSINEQVDTTLDEKERRVKRVKKEKQGKISKTGQKGLSTTKTPPRPFLQYLHQYHNSRETWKFNKNHQNHLLKHAFDVSVVPSDHVNLLYEYVRGLQGGVRTRLRDTALAIKIEDQEAGPAGFPANMTDKDQRQRDYDAAIKEYIATMTAANVDSEIGYEEGVLLGLSDKAMEKRAARRMRSERILAELAAGGTSIIDQYVHVEDDVTEHFTKDNEVPLKLARKRKQRTVVIDDSSSSESSDSSSDEEDSSDDSSATDEDGSSSSSSSSASSGSDSGASGDTEDSLGEGSESD